MAKPSPLNTLADLAQNDTDAAARELARLQGLRTQAEQQLNARYLAGLGYGAWAPELTDEVLTDFLERLPVYEEAVAGYEQQGNDAALASLEDVLQSALTARRNLVGRRVPG